MRLLEGGGLRRPPAPLLEQEVCSMGNGRSLFLIILCQTIVKDLKKWLQGRDIKVHVCNVCARGGAF